MAIDFDVSDGELAVLEVLWGRPKSTVREITQVIYNDDTFSKYKSTQKLLERVEKKACVQRDRSAAAHTFVAKVTRDAILGRRLEQVAETLCGGSLTPLLLHLVGRTKLRPSEREALQKLIDQRKK